VLTGRLDPRVGLSRLDEPRQQVWARRLEEAETTAPSGFEHNGWVVQALQAAWSAITHTPVPAEDPANATFRAQHLQHSLEAAVRGGRDTDTVAAIAGGLLGATYGSSAVPAAWRRLLHGWWPDGLSEDLTALGTAITTGGAAAFDGDYGHYSGGTALAQHPYDDQVWLGGIDAQLIDKPRPQDNPNLAFVLHDTVTVLEQLRHEGRTVLLHCVQAQSRTPSVAALYGARKNGVSTTQALHDIHSVLPEVDPNPAFRAALRATEGPR